MRDRSDKIDNLRAHVACVIEFVLIIELPQDAQYIQCDYVRWKVKTIRVFPKLPGTQSWHIWQLLLSFVEFIIVIHNFGGKYY